MLLDEHGRVIGLNAFLRNALAALTRTLPRCPQILVGQPPSDAEIVAGLHLKPQGEPWLGLGLGLG